MFLSNFQLGFATEAGAKQIPQLFLMYNLYHSRYVTDFMTQLLLSLHIMTGQYL